MIGSINRDIGRFMAGETVFLFKSHFLENGDLQKKQKGNNNHCLRYGVKETPYYVYATCAQKKSKY